MNVRRFLVNCLVAVSIGIPLRVSEAAELPAFVRTTTNGAAVRPNVVAFIEKQVATLKTDGSGRQKLIDEVLPGGPNPATLTPAFLDVYADVLNSELLKLANDPDPRLRLNAAIVAAKVSVQAKNVRLIPTIVDLLDDPHEGIVSWALKATEGVLIPAHTAAAGMQGPKLIPAFDAAAKKYITSGPMMQNAYSALKVVDAPNVPANATKSAIDSTHKLLQARRELYLEALPEFPQNESGALSFLSAQRIFRAQAPPQQLQTVQLISDMTGMVAQYYGTMGAIQRSDLAEMIKHYGGALLVIGNWTNTAPKMKPFADPLYQVRSTLAPDDVMKRATAAYEGLKTFAAWKDLKAFPTLKAP